MARRVPSGWETAVVPMKAPSRTSASSAFSATETRTSSASCSFSVSPLRDLTVTVLPSIATMSPRTCSGAGLPDDDICAVAAPANKLAAMNASR